MVNTCRFRPITQVLALLLTIGCLLLAPRAFALTVAEVVKDLACPCECPLILEDCNMSCGLEWKEEVGQLIQQGLTKDQIIEHFIGKYGDDARLTALQRIHGKVYQYTRSFDDIDWALLWIGITAWVALMFFGIYVSVKRLFYGGSPSV